MPCFKNPSADHSGTKCGVLFINLFPIPMSESHQNYLLREMTFQLGGNIFIGVFVDYLSCYFSGEKCLWTW